MSLVECGKSIKGSVSDYDNDQQDFVMRASVFSYKRGFVLHSQPMENKAISKLQGVLRLTQPIDLPEGTELQVVIITNNATEMNAPKGNAASILAAIAALPEQTVDREVKTTVDEI